MTRNTIPAGSAARIFTGYGPKPSLSPETGVGEVMAAITEGQAETKGLFKSQGDKLDGFSRDLTGLTTRMDWMEQKNARRGGTAGETDTRTLGERFVASDEFKAFASSNKSRDQVGMVLETKAITPISTAVGSGQSLYVPEYDPGVTSIPMRSMTVRALLNAKSTAGNTIFYAVQTVRNLNATPVAEGQLKPQSDLQYAQRTVPVETIAHFVQASRQILDDAGQVRALIDTELAYGVDFVEEMQILYGDGTGNNLFGIIPQAAAFAAPYTVPGQTDIDVLNQAIAQSELALLPATGVIMNPLDWRKILGTKDGQGRYLVGDPAGMQPRNIWNLSVATTLAMNPGSFLVGAFGIGAQIYDRMLMEILASTEDRDNFIRNLVTIRGEKRVALAVKRPQAFIFGTLPA